MGTVRQLEYFQIEEESDWGTDPDSSQTGLAPDEYSIELENDVLQQDKHTGEIDDVYVDIVGQMVRGSMSMQVWPDNTDLLLAIGGLPRNADYTIKSYSIQHYDRPKGEYLVHTGLKCDNLEITASGSDPKLKFNYDMIGKAEAGAGSFNKPTLPTSASFEFSDGIFTIGGGTEDNVEEFSISIANNLSPSEPKNTSRNIKWLDEGRRQIEVNFTIHTDASMVNHYRQIVRNRTRSLAFIATFNYPGTGSPYDTLTITLTDLVLRSAVRTGGVGDIQTIACTAVAKKPAANDAIQVATG